MTINEAIAILENHSIDYRVTGDNHLEAKDEFVNAENQYGFTWEDITNWKINDLRDWLGY